MCSHCLTVSSRNVVRSAMDCYTDSRRKDNRVQDIMVIAVDLNCSSIWHRPKLLKVKIEISFSEPAAIYHYLMTSVNLDSIGGEVEQIAPRANCHTHHVVNLHGAGHMRAIQEEFREVNVNAAQHSNIMCQCCTAHSCANNLSSAVVDGHTCKSLEVLCKSL